MPARFTGNEITATKDAIRDAVKVAVGEWMAALNTAAVGALAFNNALPNGNGHGVSAGAVAFAAAPHDELTSAGAGAPGISIAGAARAAPLPADLRVADIVAAFQAVVDEIDLF
jgi:hypothetical protein